MAIIPIEGIHSRILPSSHEAIDSGYLTHSGLMVNPIKDSIADVSGAFSGDIVLSINGVIPQTSQDLIDVINQNKPFDITLQGNQVRTLRMIPKDGKVGMMIAYKNLNFKENKKIQYS